MIERLKPFLGQMTFAALVAGILVGQFGGHHMVQRPIDARRSLHDASTGTNMPLIIQSDDLRGMITGEPREHSVKISHGQLFVPDESSRSYDCRDEEAQTHETKVPLFFGKLQRQSIWYKPAPPNIPAEQSSTYESVTFHAEGSLYDCSTGSKQIIASSVAVDVPIPVDVSTSVEKSNLLQFGELRSVATYASLAAKVYVTLLLIMFVPTLALSLVKSIVESAGREKTFRYGFVYFCLSSLIAATIGGLTIAVCNQFGIFTLSKMQLETVGQSIGFNQINSEFDAHPVLSQIIRIVPTNPLAALADPSGNSALQVVFVAVVIGLVLSALSKPHRQLISVSVKKMLALVIGDRELGWKSFSDYVAIIAPLGVFSLGITAFSVTGEDILHDLGHDLGALLIMIVLALFIHCTIIFLWLGLFRNLRQWFSEGFKPAFPGLVTAFATASSYASLPEIAKSPYFGRSDRRGIIDLGFTLNKNGTATYIAAAAMYLVLRSGHHEWYTFVAVSALAAFSGPVIAGLPLAAVIGLQLVLTTVGLPGALAWVILPLDPMADRFVTTMNVFSNIAAASEPPMHGLDSDLGLFPADVNAAGEEM